MARNVIPINSKSTTVDFDIPIDGRKTPIRVTMPKIGWMPPKHVKAYNAWATPLLKMEQEYERWLVSSDDDRGEAPYTEEELNAVEVREFKLRWLKPFVSDADYEAILENVPDAAADWIVALLRGEDPAKKGAADLEIATGESGASATS